MLPLFMYMMGIVMVETVGFPAYVSSSICEFGCGGRVTTSADFWDGGPPGPPQMG